MKFLKRILGICETQTPSTENSWTYAAPTITVRLSRLPEIQKPGGAVRLEGAGLSGKILVVRGTDGAYHAFSNRCTHMGRRLDPLPGQDRLECCSVSKSTFTYTGAPVSGAAKKPIKIFPTRVEGDELKISLD